MKTPQLKLLARVAKIAVLASGTSAGRLQRFLNGFKQATKRFYDGSLKANPVIEKGASWLMT
jgi:hypothetical protein